jgi:hypothetical protein
MLRGTDVMDMSGAMARGNRHQQAPTDFLNHFWIQILITVLNRFASETAARRFSEVKRPLRTVTVSELKRLQIYNAYICKSVTFIRVGPRGYFTYISTNVTTPIVSALKNYYA